MSDQEITAPPPPPQWDFNPHYLSIKPKPSDLVHVQALHLDFCERNESTIAFDSFCQALYCLAGLERVDLIPFVYFKVDKKTRKKKEAVYYHDKASSGWYRVEPWKIGGDWTTDCLIARWERYMTCFPAPVKPVSLEVLVQKSLTLEPCHSGNEYESGNEEVATENNNQSRKEGVSTLNPVDWLAAELITEEKRVNHEPNLLVFKPFKGWIQGTYHSGVAWEDFENLEWDVMTTDGGAEEYPRRVGEARIENERSDDYLEVANRAGMKLVLQGTHTPPRFWHDSSLNNTYSIEPRIKRFGELPNGELRSEYEERFRGTGAPEEDGRFSYECGPIYPDGRANRFFNEIPEDADSYTKEILENVLMDEDY